VSRARQLCWWICVSVYFLLAFALYQVLQFFPKFHRENSDLIYSIAWFPLGAGTWWIKNKLEDWVDADQGTDW
jgi:hypothetical protein